LGIDKSASRRLAFLKWVPIELLEGAEMQEPLIRDTPKFLDEFAEGEATRSQNHK